MALELWRGRASRCADEAFAQVAAAHLECVRLDAEEEMMRASLEAGEHQEIVSQLQALTATEPLRERRWALLMLALYRSGRQADALRAYRRAWAVLAEEVGLEPGRELKLLERAIIVHDPGLHSPPPVVRRTQPAARRARCRRVDRP